MNFSFPSPDTNEARRFDPEQAGTPKNNTQTTIPEQPDWVTVNDAIEYFRNSGLPRSAEAIRKYCRQEKLEANVIAGPKGDQHMINRSSIDVFVDEQLKVLQAASRSIPVRDGTTRQIPVHSVTSRVEPEHSGPTEHEDLVEDFEELKKQLERLENEKRDLEIDKEVRSRMNAVLEKNNDRLIEQIREVSQEAQEWSRKYGQLEERVQHLQIAAPVESTPAHLTPTDGRQEPTPIHYQQPEPDWGRV